MFSDSDTGALVAWFLDRHTPPDAIRKRLRGLLIEHWRAFYVFADVVLKEQERWQEPHILEKRAILEEELSRRPR